jgi:hypothetical protein
MWTEVEHFSERIVTYTACGFNCNGYDAQILAQKNTSDDNWPQTASVMLWRLTHKICLNREWHRRGRTSWCWRAGQINSLGYKWGVEREAGGRKANKAANDRKNIINTWQCHWNLNNNACKKWNMFSSRGLTVTLRGTQPCFTGKHSLSQYTYYW